jgi:hypothetical protein
MLWGQVMQDDEAAAKGTGKLGGPSASCPAGAKVKVYKLWARLCEVLWEQVPQDGVHAAKDIGKQAGVQMLDVLQAVQYRILM